MTQILIIRHGNTFNAEDTPLRIGARTDLPLVASGQEQARRLGVLFVATYTAPSLILTSPLQRALQTATIIQSECKTHPRIRYEPRLTEIDHGEDEGKTEAEVSEHLGEQALSDWNVKGKLPKGWSMLKNKRV